MRKYILFDLDGTLTDPKEGITKSVQYALAHYGIEERDLDRLCPFIGPPLTDSFQQFYSFSPEQAVEAVEIYRSYFSRRGWKENRVIPGIPEMLARLKQANQTLLLATSKPEVFAVRILEAFGLKPYFDWIGAADLEGKRVRKADVIRHVLEQAHLGTSPEVVSQCMMVGDREHDVLGARENGMDCIGVLFGYGSRRELEECGAFAIAETVRELEAMLLETPVSGDGNNIT